ncbi:beta-ketoacyl synthase N-terminal-like domain-containing protein [Xenorhabdus lircayensis]|uniref:Beta-ketoacyl synthase-like N-terminal domain-containing protein n=1 Tax=Xenorhabdus lircayensis TaxID=2763499 RepID=A0ABS0U2J1_9GAMM|nr:beta-ketoacyl synthase N-terminal-like domain-containing protein [Xenorhabdus lircayensis]MBI6548101.1 hypothetical protein [Xenorhabdus lircayensis]
MGIYITNGVSLLPDSLNMDNIIHGTIEKARLSGNTLHLPNIIGERFIEEGSFVMPTMDKMIRRAAHAQSQWVLYTGIKTWENSIGEAFSPEQRGLFIGLGTSDVDNNVYLIAFDTADDESYVSRALVETPPLTGLVLLNTSTASQLSQHLNIRGDNVFFSPHVDSGGQALLEGYYSLKEKRSEFALCGGNGQKISPWYYLAYERLMKDMPWLPAEAASFITLHGDSQKADSEIAHVYRMTFQNSNQYAHFLSEVSAWDSPPDQIIHVGKTEDKFTTLVYDTFPKVLQFNLDKAMGYTGAAAPFIAVNLAIEMHKKGVGVDNVNLNLTCQQPHRLVLILAHGLENQCIAILLRMGMTKREGL